MEVRLSAHGAYQHQYHVVWIPKYRRRILRGAIKTFVQACQVNCVTDLFSGMLALDLPREWRTG